MAGKNPILADFLAQQKGSGAGTKAGLLPPSIASDLFAKIAGASESGNYNSLNQIGSRIQQARADADQAYVLKQQREREKRLMTLIKNLQTQVSAPAPNFSGPGGSPGSGPSSIPSLGNGSGLTPGSGVRLPSIAPNRGATSILPPLVAAPPPRPKKVRFPQIF